MPSGHERENPVRTRWTQPQCGTLRLLRAVPCGTENFVSRTVRTLLTAICALYLSGAHWAVLQVTAWTGMLVSRTQTVGVEEAVRTTFDGAHPCEMCEGISAAKQEEQKQAPAMPIAKKLLEIKSPALAFLELPKPLRIADLSWFELLTEDGRRLEAPPTPPPLA